MFRLLSRLDWWIVMAVLVLAGFSLAMMSSVASQLVVAQAVFFVLGFAAFILFANIDYRLYTTFWPMTYVVSLLLLLVTFLIGIESRGAVRWVEIAGFRIQFSELLKPFLVSGFAAVLAAAPPRNLKILLFELFFVAVPSLLILKQPDLGSALVYVISFFSMVFISGVPIAYIVLLLGGVGLASPIFFHLLKDYQRARILSFLNPTSDPLGSSYNAIQSIIAVGSGMIMGKGLGHGTQSQLSFLPERHTDFAFASFAEEFGLLGTLVLLAAYLIIFVRILRLLTKAPDRYTVMLLTGLLFVLVGQVFINIGMNTGILPITGITLPLVSYGGSSVLSTMILLGIVESIARQTVEIG